LVPPCCIERSHKNVALISPFQWLFYAPLDGCYSTCCLHGWSHDAFRNSIVLTPLPHAASLLSCVGLWDMTMIQSHLRPLIWVDQQLIIGESRAGFPYQDYGSPTFHPARLFDDQSRPSGCCSLPSIWQIGNFARLQLISYH
jgi:hypothetical protein